MVHQDNTEQPRILNQANQTTPTPNHIGGHNVDLEIETRNDPNPASRIVEIWVTSGNTNDLQTMTRIGNATYVPGRSNTDPNRGPLKAIYTFTWDTSGTRAGLRRVKARVDGPGGQFQESALNIRLLKTISPHDRRGNPRQGWDPSGYGATIHRRSLVCPLTTPEYPGGRGRASHAVILSPAPREGQNRTGTGGAVDIYRAGGADVYAPFSGGFTIHGGLGAGNGQYVRLSGQIINSNGETRDVVAILAHLDNIPAAGNIEMGERIGTLTAGPNHLHFELQIDGTIVVIPNNTGDTCAWGDDGTYNRQLYREQFRRLLATEFGYP
jgi:murein DD-endopeptidase MepM/ murein hydrolase activator NlpD